MEDKTKKLLDEKVKRAEGMLSGLFLSNPELYLDYTIKPNLLSEEAQFYIGMVNRLLKKGIEVIDEITFVNDIEDNQTLMDKYEKMGGYKTIKELQMITDVNNADAIVDEWQKWNLAKRYSDKGILNLDIHIDKINRMNCVQLVDYIEYQLNDTDIDICSSDITFEDLNLTDEEVTKIKNGENMGINYGKHSPILNYLSMGLPKKDLTMVASFTNGGKSSVIMSNIIIPTAENGIKSTIISNEQQAIVYKLLLQTYVITERLNYWKLPRKKFKSGQWSEEDNKIVEKAREIIKKEYAPYITFAKVYDYDMKKVSKIAKKVSKTGNELLIYDTMKAGSEMDNVWKGLIEDSKELFQICSKYNLAGVVAFQLAPSMKNKLRILDESALANSKQIAEVFSEMFLFRDVWFDEFDGAEFDIKPYRFKKDSNGKFTKEKEYFKLDRNKKYKIFFHSKTRNDDVGNMIVYEFQGYQNKWIELGYCKVHDKNKY